MLSLSQLNFVVSCRVYLSLLAPDLEIQLTEINFVFNLHANCKNLDFLEKPKYLDL